MPITKTEVVIENAVVSYLNCFKPRETPSGVMKYSVSVLFPQTDKNAHQAVLAAIDQAVLVGIGAGNFTKAQVPGMHKPLRNGEAEAKTGQRGPEYAGKWFINANAGAENPPGVLQLVNGVKQPIVDESVMYSGCICHVHINFYPFKVPAKFGIAAGFQNILLVDQGKRLDGRISADDAFSAYGENDAQTEGGDPAF